MHLQKLLKQFNIEILNFCLTKIFIFFFFNKFLRLQVLNEIIFFILILLNALIILLFDILIIFYQIIILNIILIQYCLHESAFN